MFKHNSKKEHKNKQEIITIQISVLFIIITVGFWFSFRNAESYAVLESSPPVQKYMIPRNVSLPCGFASWLCLVSGRCRWKWNVQINHALRNGGNQKSRNFPRTEKLLDCYGHGNRKYKNGYSRIALVFWSKKYEDTVKKIKTALGKISPSSASSVRKFKNKEIILFYPMSVLPIATIGHSTSSQPTLNIPGTCLYFIPG